MAWAKRFDKDLLKHKMRIGLMLALAKYLAR